MLSSAVVLLRGTASARLTSRHLLNDGSLVIAELLNDGSVVWPYLLNDGRQIVGQLLNDESGAPRPTVT